MHARPPRCPLLVGLVVISSLLGCAKGGSGGGVATPNAPPTIAAVPALDVNENGEVIVDLSPFIVDPDLDAWVLGITSAPLHGTADILRGVELRYRPVPGYFGPDAVTLGVSDSNHAPVTRTIDIVVIPADAPPVPVADTAVVAPEWSTLLEVLANDDDPNGDALSIVAVTAPSHGVAVVDPLDPQRIEYTPTPGYCGPDQFEYSVTDGSSTASAPVLIDVICTQAIVKLGDLAIDYSFDTGSGTGTTPLSIEDPVGNAVTELSLTIACAPDLVWDSIVVDPGIAGMMSSIDATPGPGGVDVTLTFAAPIDVASSTTLAVVTFRVTEDLLRGNLFQVTAPISLSLPEAMVDGVRVPVSGSGAAAVLDPAFPAGGWFGLASPGGPVEFPSGGPGVSVERRIYLVDEGTPATTEVQAISFGLTVDTTLATITDATLGPPTAAFGGGAGPDYLHLEIVPGGLEFAAIPDFMLAELFVAADPFELLVVTIDATPTTLGAAETWVDMVISDSLGVPRVLTVDGQTIDPSLAVGTTLFRSR
ncbi:MAG: cadherin-like domain-containing protein [Planctomycetes bacterium]|nr:cadherin-like domain-containing protein [Planctomycetota bacterium]